MAYRRRVESSVNQFAFQRHPEKRAGSKPRFLQQSCNAESYTRESNSTLKLVRSDFDNCVFIAAERFELYKRPGASKTFAYEQVDELTGILRLTTFDNAGRLRG